MGQKIETLHFSAVHTEISRTTVDGLQLHNGVIEAKLPSTKRQ